MKIKCLITRDNAEKYDGAIKPVYLVVQKRQLILG